MYVARVFAWAFAFIPSSNTLAVCLSDAFMKCTRSVNRWSNRKHQSLYWNYLLITEIYSEEAVLFPEADSCDNFWEFRKQNVSTG